MTTKWWGSFDVEPFAALKGEIRAGELTKSAMLHALFFGEGHVHTANFGGYLTKPATEVAQDLLTRKPGGRILGSYIRPTPNSNKYEYRPFNTHIVWDDAFVSLYAWEGQSQHVEILAMNEEAMQCLYDTLRPLFETRPKRGIVSVIINTSQGPELMSIGKASLPLLIDNYDPSVQEAFQHVCADLVETAPCGRVSIFDGEPGTGKTFLIRALLEVEGPRFIIVNADAVPNLTGPSLIKLLIDSAPPRDPDDDDGKARPIVLLIEDADSCLAPRAGDNMSSVSTLLNLGDGIIGAMLDIRIIATTNSGHIKGTSGIDEALVRAGRLCRQVHVGKLSPEQAATVYHRETGQDVEFQSGMTLAEVYRLIKDKNFVPKKKKAGIGFGS
ncbi:AAA ATPase [Myxococcus phage Mx1]|nr:AAA ATPase [Myxococcus phage Mx1]